MACVFCGEPEPGGDLKPLTDVGYKTVLEYLSHNNHHDLADVSNKNPKDVFLHRRCQKTMNRQLTKRKSTEKVEIPSPPKKTRRSGEDFSWLTDCLYCAQKCDDADGRKSTRYSSSIRLAKSVNFRNNLLKACELRSDQWALEVKSRAINCFDFVHVKARYHISCQNKFNAESLRVENQLEQAGVEITLPSKVGRPVTGNNKEAFENLCFWLEKQTDLYSMSEIHDEFIRQSTDPDNAYERKYLKSKLKTKYGDELFFASMDGRSDVVCFRHKAEKILNDEFYRGKKESIEDEAKRIVKKAADLIRSDVKGTLFDCSVYPTKSEIESVEFGVKWLPPLLRFLLENLISSDVKQASIGQSVIHAMRPRSSLPPILFGLSVEMDHLFGSKWLDTEASRLGFGVSHDEVQRYKQSIVQHENFIQFIKISLANGSFGQWAADNVDHNVRTLDGKGVLHGMGIVFMITGTKEQPAKPTQVIIPREKLKKVSDITKKHQIDIHPYNQPEISGLSKLKFTPISKLLKETFPPRDKIMDLIWHAKHFSLVRDDNGRPGWSGYMSNVAKGEYPGKSVVVPLPIIDLDPTDMSCVYSTIMFIIKQTKELGLPTPIITFDQPLWLKATEIVASLSLDVVLILGGFHMMMSFAGSIGDIMAGSGIGECFGTVFGSTAVKHMLTGKAIARSLRAHFLLESVLSAKLMKDFFGVTGGVVNGEEDLEPDESTSLDVADDADLVPEVEMSVTELESSRNFRVPDDADLVPEMGTSFSEPDSRLRRP